MVKFSFYRSNGRLISNIDASDDLPNDITSMRVEGPFDSKRSTYKVFTYMLRRSPKKLKEITIVDFDVEVDSPEFLSFLVLICNKTGSLRFESCCLSTNAASCLMATLMMHGGIRHLSCRFEYEMPHEQVRLLLEGVACSPCLESFDFKDWFSESFISKLGTYLIQALNRNKSLKDISIDGAYLEFGANDCFQDLVKAAILGPKRRAVRIEAVGTERELQFDKLQDILCRKDCTLQMLHLEGFEFLMEDEWDGSIMQNVSVTSIKLSEVIFQKEGGLPKFLSLFKSLEEIHLSRCELTQLSFLDPLLLGESAKLKSLNVSLNEVGDEEASKFIAKLRKIKSLKHLKIWCWGSGALDREAVSTGLKNVLKYNTDLEYVDWCSQDLRLALNRGGRRIFESSQAFPANLLPHVLERASKIAYYKSPDGFGSPSSKEEGADVVFWMLQRIAAQL